MGCDIHCYIEYRAADREDWNGFGGRINPGRNYSMFGAMAGVRTDRIPHLAPRGIPDDLASKAFGDVSHFISERQEEPWSREDGETYYSRAHAEACVAKGYCRYIARGAYLKSFVTNSDWHSHSWLTPDEFEIAICAYLKESGYQLNTLRLPAPAEVEALAKRETGASAAHKCLTEYWAILQCLRCFEAQGKVARLVFWFDN